MLLLVKVTPRAKKTEVIGKLADNTLKIRLNAVPESGEANKELIRFLAETLGLKKDRVKMVSGFTSQRKQLRIPDSTVLPW